MSLECQKCEDNFCCIYLGRRICAEHCRRQNCFCISCQLYITEEKGPAVLCQKCSFLLECYSYKYLGKLNYRNSYVLQKHCIDHSELEDCPHLDEATVELNRLVPPPDYSHLVQDGNSSQTIVVHQQGTGSQQLQGRETAVPSGKAYPRMVPRVPKKNRSRPKGLLATQRARRTGRSLGRPGRNTDVRSEPRLSSRTVIGTRSTNRPCYRGM